MNENTNYQKDLDIAVIQVKKIILAFVKKYYNEETYRSVEETVNTVKFAIDDNPILHKFGVAYCNGKSIFVSREYFIKERGTLDLLKTLLHECGHLFSDNISGRTRNYPIIEEGFAEIFSEICINSYIKNNEIDYISNEEQNMLERDGCRGSKTRIQETNFIKNILYALSVKGRDLDALKEYFFGSKERFFEICNITLGSDFEDKIINSMGNQTMEFGALNTEKYQDIMNNRLYQILENSIEGTISEAVFNQNVDYQNGQLYSINSHLLQGMYLQKKIEHEWLQEKFTPETISEDKIKKLSKLSNEKVIMYVAQNGFNQYLKDIISIWYNQCDGDINKFNSILELTGAIPLEQAIQIINDKASEVDSTKYDFAKIILFKYNTIFVKSEKCGAMEYLVNNASPEEYSDILKMITEGKLYFDEDICPSDETIDVIDKIKPTKNQMQSLAGIYIDKANVKPRNIIEIYKYIELCCNQDELDENNEIGIGGLVTSINELTICYSKFDSMSELREVSEIINRIKQKGNLYVDDIQSIIQGRIETLQYMERLKEQKSVSDFPNGENR